MFQLPLHLFINLKPLYYEKKSLQEKEKTNMNKI